MSDCTNIEIRELWPEYLAGRAGADRARIDAHLAVCEECAAELELLRSVRQAYGRVAPVDVAAIVRALPRRRPRASRRFTALKIAAAVSFISVGGISLAVARSLFNEPMRSVVDSTGSGGVDTAAGSSGSLVAAAGGISFGGGVSDLAAEELEALLSAIESIEAAPVAEPPDAVFGSEASGRAGASQE